MNLRPAFLAGTWYPASSDSCARALVGMATISADPAGARGAIVPHAGWAYSGAIAFSALKCVRDARPNADLIVVFGGHLSPREPIRVFVDDGFDTPFGPVVAARKLATDVAMALGEVTPESADDPSEGENGIEVLLPMVKSLWPNAPVLAIGAPPTPEAITLGREVARLARVHGYDDVVAVGSTDLTHYGPNYRFEPRGRGASGLHWVKMKNDPEVVDKMIALDATGVLWVAERSHNACCAGAAAAAISLGRAAGANRADLVDYRTSWDIRPEGSEPSSFVGYAGIVMRES